MCWTEYEPRRCASGLRAPADWTASVCGSTVCVYPYRVAYLFEVGCMCRGPRHAAARARDARDATDPGPGPCDAGSGRELETRMENVTESNDPVLTSFSPARPMADRGSASRKLAVGTAPAPGRRVARPPTAVALPPHTNDKGHIHDPISHSLPIVGVGPTAQPCELRCALCHVYCMAAWQACSARCARSLRAIAVWRVAPSARAIEAVTGRACALLVGDASHRSWCDGLAVAVHGAACVLEPGRLPARFPRGHLGLWDGA